MAIIILIAASMLGFGYLFLNSAENIKFKSEKLPFWSIALVCAIVKIVIASVFYGHQTDMNCFLGWSEMIFDGGFSNFYSSNTFTDYPPGYMYVLYMLGAIRKIPLFDNFVVLKIPAILSDIIVGFLICKVGENRLNCGLSRFLSVLYMLNPSVIINSSVWGQVDGIYTACIVGVLLLLINKKHILSFYLFAICIFIKPQALIYTPVIFFSVFDDVFLSKFKPKTLLKYFAGALGAIFLMLLLALPFGLENVFKQYVSTIASYPYLTVNAFNLWGALGQNWIPVTTYFSVLGTIFIIVITCLSAVIYFKTEGNERYFTTAGFLGFATYMLSVKMHDRYAFPAIAMFIMAYIYSKKKDDLLLFICMSVSQFINTAWVLFVYERDINYYASSPAIVVFSLLNLVLLGYIIIRNIKIPVFFKKYKDSTIVAIISVVYSAVAFANLGSFVAPENYGTILSGESATIEFAEQTVSELLIYPGANEIDETLDVVCYLDNNEILNMSISADVFCWNSIDISDNISKIKLKAKKNFDIMEIAVKNSEGNIVPIKCSISELFDEQNTVPKRKSYINGTYFDEIYHARTAYEFIEGKPVYEWTHPPLGKVFISIGIKLFGMSPFGWRVCGTVFGILMIPLIYTFLKKIFKSSFISTVGTILMTFDFMHFTQTRISTIDVYVTFFIMLMYLFMYKYYEMDFNTVSLKRRIWQLMLSGISFGLAASCKWTAIYACVGLAVIFFIKTIGRFFEVGKAFRSEFIKTGFFCVFAFILVPVVIYILSYIPYLLSNGDFSFSAILENQQSMFVYHSKTVVNSTHPYSSHWYQWPIMYRPLWYYSGDLGDGIKEGISAFGNPVVWWTGIPAFFACLYYAFKKDRNALFIIIGYLSSILPWVFVERTTYIYHYFPCVPFVVLMICLVVSKLKGKVKLNTGIILCVLAIVLFMIFYPVLSGAAVSEIYVERLLRWFSSWVLI